MAAAADNVLSADDSMFCILQLSTSQTAGVSV